MPSGSEGGSSLTAAQSDGSLVEGLEEFELVPAPTAEYGISVVTDAGEEEGTTGPFSTLRPLLQRSACAKL